MWKTVYACEHCGKQFSGPMGHACEASWGRYEGTKYGSATPSPAWQAVEYERVMAQEPPAGEDPQFQYNPRTKAGKALLSDLVASQGHSNG